MRKSLSAEIATDRLSRPGLSSRADTSAAVSVARYIATTSWYLREIHCNTDWRSNSRYDLRPTPTRTLYVSRWYGAVSFSGAASIEIYAHWKRTVCHSRFGGCSVGSTDRGMPAILTKHCLTIGDFESGRLVYIGAIRFGSGVICSGNDFIANMVAMNLYEETL